MVEIMSQSRGEEDEDNSNDETGTDTEDGMMQRTNTVFTLDEDRLHMDAARIYEKTIVQLGERMGDGGLLGSS